MNKHIKTFFITLVVVSSFLTLLNFNSCKEPLEPIDPITKIELGRRDYTWEEDTLIVPPHNDISFRDMVGNSPNDIWLGSLEPGLWHYDGEKWELTEFPGATPSALWLFEDNTLWIGTRQKLILKKENGVWVENDTLTYKNHDWIDIFGMYGKEKDDIYAVGSARETIIPREKYARNGIILHYNENNWKFLNIPNLEEINLNSIHYQKNINTYFITALKIENGVILDKLFVFDGSNLTELLSTPGSIALSTVNEIVYIKHNYKEYKYSNKQLVLWKDFEGTEFLSSFVGRSENDFFNNSTKGIGHYNGIDYVTIYPTHLETYSKIVFEKEIFCAAIDPNNRHYIIIHGTLKDK